MEDLTLDQGRRVLLFFAGCWALRALSYLNITPALRWAPHLVGWLYLAATLGCVAVAVRPGRHLLYRVAGCVGGAAHVLALFSAGFGLSLAGATDAGWIALSGTAFTAAIVVLWAWFWTGPVRRWQQDHGS
jgi:O-antigen/teichoic acid export membrane protein